MITKVEDGEQEISVLRKQIQRVANRLHRKDSGIQDVKSQQDNA